MRSWDKNLAKYCLNTGQASLKNNLGETISFQGFIFRKSHFDELGTFKEPSIGVQESFESGFDFGSKQMIYLLR